MTDLLADALGYRDRGISIIPIRHLDPSGKQPAIPSYKRYANRIASRDTVRRWFKDNRMDGVAAVLGPISGNLACRDFDVEASYESWRIVQPELAAELPTARTADGYHVYFTGDIADMQARTGVPCCKPLGDGELRFNGVYCLLPHSKHPDGVTTYTWTVSLGDELPPAIDPFAVGLADAAPCEEKWRSGDLEKQRSREVEAIGERCSFDSFSPNLLGQIELAIEATMPSHPGSRNRAIFDFVRTIRGMPEFENADPTQLRELVKMWHLKAEPNTSGEHDWTDSFAEFIYGWERARVPMGVNPLRPALERADKDEPPEIASQFPNLQIRRLIGLCCELQRMMGSARFWLTWEDAGELLGIHYNTAGKYLNLLVAEGILKRHLRQSQREATRYNYLPPI